MGACCTVERSPDDEISGTSYSDGYNSILFHQEMSSTGINYNLVYRPPSKNGRLTPGEAKPRFWTTPYTSNKGSAVVSVAWGNPAQTSYLKCISRNRRAKQKTKPGIISACLPGTRHEQNFKTMEVGSTTLECGDYNNLSIKTYPEFILPFLNKTIRLYLMCTDSKISHLVGAYGHLKPGVFTDPTAELSHLVRNVHWLNLHLTYSISVNGLPQIDLQEHHGGIKRLRKIRYRIMTVSWIDIDHKKPRIKIIGENFLLSLEPSSPLQRLVDLPEGSKEYPPVIGHYVRYLDTTSDSKIEFNVYLFQRHNQPDSESITSHGHSQCSPDGYEYEGMFKDR